MSVILDCKFNDVANKYADMFGYGGGDYGIRGRREMAECGVGGFGLVEDSDGSPLGAHQDFRSYYNCDCQELITKSNSEAAFSAFKAEGVEAWDWNGLIAFDASNTKGIRIAEEIANTLSGYPSLDDDRLSELEWDMACELVDQWAKLPDGIEADDVVRAMPEVPYCSNCSSCDIDAAIESLGYQQCNDCDEWLLTTVDKAMCHDCAESEAITECECLSVYVDTMRHGGTYASLDDVREIQRGCEACYPVMYPNTNAYTLGA